MRHTALAPAADRKAIAERVKTQVAESGEVAENSPYPMPAERYKDV